MASKNQGRMAVTARQLFYEGDKDCLRKYNYSTGAGWKTKCKANRRLSFAVKSKRSMSRGYNY